MQIKRTDFRIATPNSDKKYSKVRARLMSNCQFLCEQKWAHIRIDPWYAHDGDQKRTRLSVGEKSDNKNSPYPEASRAIITRPGDWWSSIKLSARWQTIGWGNNIRAHHRKDINWIPIDSVSN